MKDDGARGVLWLEGDLGVLERLGLRVVQAGGHDLLATACADALRAGSGHGGGHRAPPAATASGCATLRYGRRSEHRPRKVTVRGLGSFSPLRATPRIGCGGKARARAAVTPSRR